MWWQRYLEKIAYPRDPCLLVWRGGLATGRVIVHPEKCLLPLLLGHKIGGVARLWKGDSESHTHVAQLLLPSFLLLWNRAGMEPVGSISPWKAAFNISLVSRYILGVLWAVTGVCPWHCFIKNSSGWSQGSLVGQVHARHFKWALSKSEYSLLFLRQYNKKKMGIQVHK